MPERAFSRRDTLSALLLPLAERELVVPDVAVAELIGYRQGVLVGATAPWDLGDISWRGRQVPLVSFEAACGQPLPRGERVRIAVMHGIGPRLPFFALLMQGIPRTYRVDSQLSYIDVPLASLELAAVLVGSEVARVPDLDGLAEAILSARLNAG
ncbi:chemotaxis protein CheW [Pseudomonas sp. RIT-PI-S]|uniref:chemotaxis protein CheW n=1 Tax=Pseudomonas sp. RIT-PI-S TaxID=3035295 RepID=UPI0021D97D1A|nr:chemotaxis protein CheW [Pseudomonas sp. RIT-PI-S]